MIIAILAELDTQEEDWALVGMLVLAIALFLLVLSVMRRRLLRPMDHRPSDTTDAWAEAGRRLPPPPPETDENPSEDETA